MINFHHKFTVIHAPKTGGNSLHFHFMNHNLYPSGAVGHNPNQNGEEGINPVGEWLQRYTPQGKHESLEIRAKNLRAVGENPDEYVFIIPRRNPWDQMVSWYFWERKNAAWDKASFLNYLHGSSAYRANDVFRLWSGHGKYQSFFVDAYHQLRDTNQIFTRWGIQFDSISQRNKSLAREDNDYRKYYDDETREVVRRTWAAYINMFSYKFDV